jgi:hypothetical protein
MPTHRAVRWLLWPALAALCVAGLGWLAGADEVVGQPLMLSKRPVALHNRQDLGQTFSVPSDGLHRIDVQFGVQRELRDRQVRLVVYDEERRPIVDQEIDAAELRDGWYSFEFPPLGGVAGRSLRFDLGRNAPARAAVSVFIGPGTAYAEGYGVIDNVPDPSFDLAFRAYSATPITPAARIQRLWAVAQSAAAGHPGPFGQPGLMVGLGALYGVGLATLAWVILGRQRWRR